MPALLSLTSTALDFMHAIFLGTFAHIELYVPSHVATGVVATLFNKFLFGAHLFSGIGGADSAKQRLENIINSVQWPSHVTRLPKNVRSYPVYVCNTELRHLCSWA